VEVHAGVELDVALGAGARVIGVNNRNLHTFQMNLSTTSDTAAELARRGLSFHHGGEEATPEYTICALSGMSSSSDVHRYRQCGVAMCLIGESLMRAADPKAAIASLCLDPADYETSNDTIATAVGSAYTAGTKLVKVCGITNPEDALVACRASANLIGIIFAAKSKRCIQSVEQGHAIVQAVREFGERTDRVDILANYDNENESKRSPLEALVRKSKLLQEAARRPLVVGVFQNQDSSFIADMVEQCGLDLVQLHGKEGMAAANPKLCGGVPALRVVDIETRSASSGETDQEDTESDPTKRILEALTSDPLAILLDTSIKGDKSGGGTGVTFDWTIAETLQNNGLPVLIAGGLQAENVEKAVSSVRPWGVDVSSGVEASPGQKNHQQVTAFCNNVRHAAKEASKGF
jgi:anthranilate synthase/indole-3-glycerol phosphate synthase/phosphoribosylanthranilate isomerase